ncbi:MAG: MBL fold metallo-hydrolase, partial [Bacteroidota bacterium]|nr:MBL fold metallo-hydrolase [Bacteroidota bacterium]MDX5431352.1 MBL fold metallo-hydrolase [Bacteroidota bacterium]MDX5470080.1 MBL fold metallo-hydrolase [Bacteroidota bacterium]
NETLTFPPSEVRSYAYVSDTRFFEELKESIQGVDMLYHESTFLHELKDRADETFHSTALDAARMAQLAGAKKLILGHYSARYRDLTPLLEEAKTLFENSHLAIEGSRFSVD